MGLEFMCLLYAPTGPSDDEDICIHSRAIYVAKTFVSVPSSPKDVRKEEYET